MSQSTIDDHLMSNRSLITAGGALSTGKGLQRYCSVMNDSNKTTKHSNQNRNRVHVHKKAHRSQQLSTFEYDHLSRVNKHLIINHQTKSSSHSTHCILSSTTTSDTYLNELNLTRKDVKDIILSLHTLAQCITEKQIADGKPLGGHTTSLLTTHEQQMQNSVDLLTMLCSKSENHTLEKFENVHSVETHQNKRKRRKECQRGLSSEQPDGHRLIKRMYRVEDLQRDLYGMNKYDLQLAKRFANATCSSYADVSLRIQHKTAKSTDPLVEKKRSSSTVAMAKQILDSNEQSILQSHLYEQKHASSIQTPKQAKIIQVIEEKKSNSINSYLPSKFSVKTTTTQQTVQSSQYKKQSSDAILQMSNQHTDQELTITEKSSLHRTLCRTDMTKSMPIISSTENENNAQISSEEPHTKFESGDHEIYRVNVATQWSKQSLEKVEDILNKSSIMTIDDADGKNQTPKFHFDELNKTPLNSTISTELSCCDLKRSSDVYLSNSATKNDASYDDQNSSNMRKNDLDYTIVDRHKISSEKNVKDSVRIQSTEGYVRLNDYTVVYACSNVTQQSTKVPLNSPNTSVQQLLINSEQILQDLNIPTCECSIENLVKNIDGKNITRVSLNSFSTIENLIQHKKRVKNKIMHAPIKVQSKRTARQRRQTISNRKQQQNKRRRLSKQLPLTNNKKNEKELEDSSSFDFFDFDTLTSKSYDHLFASNSEKSSLRLRSLSTNSSIKRRKTLIKSKMNAKSKCALALNMNNLLTVHGSAKVRSINHCSRKTNDMHTRSKRKRKI